MDLYGRSLLKETDLNAEEFSFLVEEARRLLTGPRHRWCRSGAISDLERDLLPGAGGAEPELLRTDGHVSRRRDYPVGTRRRGTTPAGCGRAMGEQIISFPEIRHGVGGLRARRGKGRGVAGDVLMTLAQFAGQTVASAAITDVWETFRGRVARLLGQGDKHRTEAAERWLAQTRQQLEAASPGQGLEQARDAAAERWTDRFADLLDEDPTLEAKLRALAEEIAAQLPAGAVSAGGHSVAAGRDVNIAASDGSVAAGVVHGNVTPPGPTPPGPAQA
jgi:hypothetical protein